MHEIVDNEDPLTQEEIEFIRANWPSDGNARKITEITRKLKFYSMQRILREASAMGLNLGKCRIRKFHRRWQPWTEKADEVLLKSLKDGKPLEEIAKETGRSLESIKLRIYRLRHEVGDHSSLEYRNRTWTGRDQERLAEAVKRFSYEVGRTPKAIVSKLNTLYKMGWFDEEVL